LRLGTAGLELSNPDAIDGFLLPEIDFALDRAYAAGARGRVRFVGAGAYGIVFCDEGGTAWKVFRLRPDSDELHLLFVRGWLIDEYEWLTTAAESAIAPFVASVVAAHLDPLVLERECVQGRPGGWSDENTLWDLHEAIAMTMEPLGWTAPEFKGSSYIIQENGEAKLVDISQVQRVGFRLADWIEDIVEGRTETYENWSTLAYYLIRELNEDAIPEDRAMELLDRIAELDPSVRNIPTPRKKREIARKAR